MDTVLNVLLVICSVVGLVLRGEIYYTLLCACFELLTQYDCSKLLREIGAYKNVPSLSTIGK